MGKISERTKTLVQECHSELKLRTYVQLKSQLIQEPYLDHGGYLARAVMFSLRSSSCRLRIETGRRRRPREKEEERVCILCERKEVESEVHFVVSCEKYTDLRFSLYKKVFEISKGLLDLSKETDKFKIFQIVVGDGWGEDAERKQIFQASLNFVYLAMKRRSQVLRDRIV